jgi:hypothetical protein
MWRLLFIGFLVVHGFIHLGVRVTPKPEGQKPPFDPSHSWLLGDRHSVDVALAVVSAGLLMAAGVALLAHAGVWRPLAVAGSSVSLALVAVYFNPWLSLAVALDAGRLVGIAWLDWLSLAFAGA